MLGDRYSRALLKETFRDDLHPFPTYAERDAWRRVAPETARPWIETAEGYQSYDWPAITAEMYLTLKTTGELKPHWNRFRERRSGLGILALGECFEGEGRFLSQIVNGIQAICEETSWIQPLNMRPHGFELPDESNYEVELCASETAALLVWILYLLGDELDRVSLRIRARINQEILRRIVRPYLDRSDYWWMGFTQDRINNWNPWCNMNVIMCLLLADIGDETRVEALHKVLVSLDAYIDTYAPDGCCDEGPGYWGAAGAGLYICLSLLREATGGAIDVFDEPIIGEIGRYIVKAHIDGIYFVNYADGDAKVQVNAITYLYGKALGDAGMMALGAGAPPMKPTVNHWFFAYQYLQDIFTQGERRAYAAKPSYPRDAWLWHTQVMMARERAGDARGLFLSAKAGNNVESHNHNDVGNFVIYLDGQPLIIDIGTEEYSVKTFSPERYEIWYTQSQYHNCPGYAGALQHVGKEYFAENVSYEMTDARAEIRMDIARAYPAEAGIASWTRTIALIREGSARVEVADAYSLSAATAVERYLITPCRPEDRGGYLALPCAGREARIEYDARTTEAVIEEYPLTESRLIHNWGEVLFRIILRERVPALSGALTMAIGAS